MTSGSASTQMVKSGWMQRQSEVFKRWKRQFCVLYLDGGFSYFTDETRRNSEGSLHLPTSLNLIKVGVEILDVTAPSDRTMSCLLELQTTSSKLVFCAESSDDAEAWKSAMVEVKNMNVRGGSQAPQQPPQYTSPPPAQAPSYQVQPPQAPPYQAQPPQAPPKPPQNQPGYPQAYPPPYPQAVPPSGPPPCYAATQQQVVTTTVYRNGRRRYPTQTTVYSYPGQTYFGSNGNTTVYSTNPGTTVYTAQGTTTQQPGHTTVVVQENRNRNDAAAVGFVAGAAVGTMMMAPILFW